MSYIDPNAEQNLTDEERIDLIANLILEIITEEFLQIDGAEPCMTS